MSEQLCVDFSTSIEKYNEDQGRSNVRSYRAAEKNQGYKKIGEDPAEERWKIGYKRDLNTAYFVVESGAFYQTDYQMKMISANDIPGILKIKGKGVNGRSRYEYDIQGKHSLEFMTKKEPVTYDMIIGIITDLLDTIEEMRDYLLSPNQLLMDPRSIFFGNGRYSFCYYPPNDKGIAEGFHELTEFFVREADYQDRSGIYIAYALHKMTLGENYQIRQVIEEILRNQEEEWQDQEEEPEKDADPEETDEDWNVEEYVYGETEDSSQDDSMYDDWGLEDKPFAETVKEKLQGWKRVKELLFGKKKLLKDLR